jgi:hypothetical protein
MQDKQPHETAAEQFLQFVSPAFRTNPDWDNPLANDPALPQDPVSFRKLQELLTAFLNSWIESGFSPDGSEWPRSRHLMPRSPASVAMQRYLEQTRPTVWLHPKGGYFVDFVLQPGDPYDGRTARMRDDDIERVATAIFIRSFYNSGGVFNVMRCAMCSAYQFVRKPRKSYVRGWHCSVCTEEAPHSKASTKATRATHRKKWLSLAGEAWNSWNPKKHGRDRILWITEQVNRGLAWHEKIKRNSISMNQGEIQVEAAKVALAGRADAVPGGNEPRPPILDGSVLPMIRCWPSSGKPKESI